MENFILKKDFYSPYVINKNGIKSFSYKHFKKGQIIKGVLKKDDKYNPVFVLVDNYFVIPVNFLKKLSVSEISEKNDKKENIEKNEKKIDFTGLKNRRFKVIDGIIIGGVLGVLVVYLMEKKGYIEIPNKTNKIIGGVLGASILGYYFYRKNQKTL
ncbi:MAG: hypothetical protein QXM96_00265 [Candidatus Woesearchaeota archaeon]